MDNEKKRTYLAKIKLNEQVQFALNFESITTRFQYDKHWQHKNLLKPTRLNWRHEGL